MSYPPRPSAWEERAATFMLRSFGPRLPHLAPVPPPRLLAPFESFAIPRQERGGHLGATWYPADGPARGAVLLVHPWIEWGQAYFHRRGRIAALRRAGCHALTFDFSGFGASARPAGLPDRDIEDALAALRERAGDLPVLVWGISAGGSWAHTVLSRDGYGVAGAVFEDVSPHLLEWSHRAAPLLRPAYAVFRRCLPRAYRYLDLRRHAPALRLRAAVYVSGAADTCIRPEETRELARLAGAECLVVEGAGHLAAIKLAGSQVLALALATLERAL